ncbi:hypothetical protein V8G54_027050 [Vigna mungo]|uniref:Uncharacterized protein n=1 Tax=Vigna mungo TaxID=3915 RepID=A0AAQ3N259_VIGMU
MKSFLISFSVSVRENFSGRSSFSGDPLNFGDFPTLGHSATGFVVGLIWGSSTGFSECKVEDEDAREDMMEKNMLSQRSNLVRMVATLGFGGVNGGFMVMVEDDNDLRF